MIALERENLQKFCRTCLNCLQSSTGTTAESATNYDIRETPDLTKLLVICTTWNISEDSDAEYPQQLCKKCYEMLQEFKRFREMAIKSGEVLRGIVENTDGILISENVQAEKLLNTKYEDTKQVNFANYFEASETHLSDYFNSVHENEEELDVLILTNNKEIKIETVMSDNDSLTLYENQADSSADISIAEGEDMPSTSRAAAKRKLVSKTGSQFSCTFNSCGAVFNTNKTLQAHWKECHNAGNETIQRKKYKCNSPEDRRRIVEAANRCEDWVRLSATLGVKYKTAYTWVSNGQAEFKRKGGQKPKALSPKEVEEILGWIERDQRISLSKIAARLEQHLGKRVALSTISNYLDGQLYSIKNVHTSPTSQNIIAVKEKRAICVASLNELIQAGKQIVWIGETNFNLICRHSRSSSTIGHHGIKISSASVAPHVNLIGAITTFGVLSMERRRVAFSAALAKEWILTVIQKWQDIGNNLNDLIFVCDNAPCHTCIESAVASNSNDLAKVLRLGPYSSMLNPIDIIWSKIKTYARSQTDIPPANDSELAEQRLVYLEEVIDRGIAAITAADCEKAVEECAALHAKALALEDMPVVQ